MTWKECSQLIKDDYKRLIEFNPKNASSYRFIKNAFFDDSFCVTFWFRLGTFMWGRRAKPVMKIPYFIVRNILSHESHKTGIQISIGTLCGGGLKFFHYGSVIIANSVILGKNVSIHHDVTLGRIFTGPNKGVPTIGDNVVIFPGAKIIGNIRIGNNVVIGANAVVLNDVPDNCVVAGNVARIISHDSSKCFDEYWTRIFARTT